MSDLIDGTVLWYRPSFGRGAVRLDTGRHFLFTRVQKDLELANRLRVQVAMPEEGDDGGVKIIGFEDGRREFAAEIPIRKKRDPRKRSRKSSQPGIPEGTSVLHTSHGQGFVVSATAKMARVRFTTVDEERTVRIANLSRLDGQDSPAPA